MTLQFNQSEFDLVLVKGPQTQVWPSVGVKELSKLCTRFGLKVGWVGDQGLRAKGVIPSQKFGGLVIAEDEQGRVHRIQAKSIVKFKSPNEIPPTFSGWESSVLIPGASALRLMKDANLHWNVPVAILGSGTRALQTACMLLEGNCKNVYVIDEVWRSWSVFKNRFDQLGGKWIVGSVTQIKELAPQQFVIKVGTQELDVSRVLSFGPFYEEKPIKEYPTGSLLFELSQTALETEKEDSEGYLLEIENAQLLASQIIKTIGTTTSDAKKEIEFYTRKAKSRIRKFSRYKEQPFEYKFQGKWMDHSSKKNLLESTVVPKAEHLQRKVASIECNEGIACQLCESACPENAIQWDRMRPVESKDWINFREKDCTACGACLEVCPSSTPVMLHEKESHSLSSLTLHYRGKEKWKTGDQAILLNRRGDELGSARVSEVTENKLVTLEVPSHLIWEARSIRYPTRSEGAIDHDFLDREVYLQEIWKNKVEIILNGEKRWIRSGIPLTLAFFESGINRPQDRLSCPEASCKLCDLEVDGLKQLACQTVVRKGMTVKTVNTKLQTYSEPIACPCLGLTEKELKDRLHLSGLSQVESLQLLTRLGEGRCHGQLCLPTLKKLLSKRNEKQELDTIDWKFPWEDWDIYL